MSAANRESKRAPSPHRAAATHASGQPVSLAAASRRVLIADGHELQRRGMRMALAGSGFEVAEAADRAGALRAVLAERTDVCLLDIDLRGGGLHAAREIARAEPATAIVMLTVSDETEDVLAALRAGAVGYLPKDIPPDRLAAALWGVLRGEAALSRALVARVLGELHGGGAGRLGLLRVGGVELTPRESEILRLLQSGRTTFEIGELLGLSPITVRRHISSGVAKLGVADRAAALRAIERPSAA